MLAALACLLALAACQAAPDAPSAPQPAPGGFARHLAAEYRDYADALAEEGDDGHAAEFSARADDAASGNPPDPLGDRGALKESRARLLALRETSVLPHLLARAQVMHDCAALTGEALCETARQDALALLEEAEDTGRAVHQHRILFAPGSIRLEESGREVVRRIGMQLLALGDYRVTVAGHAESSGSEAVDAWLSHRRALNVALALEDLGLPKSRLETLAQGSTIAPIEGEDANRVDIRIDLLEEPS